MAGGGGGGGGGGGDALNLFVLTSNADGLFEQSGFDPSKLLTIQGDYGFLQCLEEDCGKKVVNEKKK